MFYTKSERPKCRREDKNKKTNNQPKQNKKHGMTKLSEVLKQKTKFRPEEVVGINTGLVSQVERIRSNVKTSTDDLLLHPVSVVPHYFPLQEMNVPDNCLR